MEVLPRWSKLLRRRLLSVADLTSAAVSVTVEHFHSSGAVLRAPCPETGPNRVLVLSAFRVVSARCSRGRNSSQVSLTWEH